MYSCIAEARAYAYACIFSVARVRIHGDVYEMHF